MGESIEGRPIFDRIQDRIWKEAGRWLTRRGQAGLAAGGGSGDGTSISAGSPWVEVCRLIAEAEVVPDYIRRMRAVREIVETVSPSEGRHYARRIHEWGGEWMGDAGVARIDAWGNPMRWPGLLLGAPRAFSPTTLRYLATALWLRRRGIINDGCRVIEVGVGFGGLAAMNALVSGASTMLVDLPEVERAARRMVQDCGFGDHVRASESRDGAPEDGWDLFISNYAFTELSTAEQDRYGELYLKRSRHGMILSNAAVFAETIGGRDDGTLLNWLRGLGVAAEASADDVLLGPADRLCGVRLITW